MYKNKDPDDHDSLYSRNFPAYSENELAIITRITNGELMPSFRTQTQGNC